MPGVWTRPTRAPQVLLLPRADRTTASQPPSPLCVTRTSASRDYTTPHDGRAPFVCTCQYLILPATPAVSPPDIHTHTHLQTPDTLVALVLPFDFHAHAHIQHMLPPPATPAADPHFPQFVVATTEIIFTTDSARTNGTYGKPEQTTTSVLRRDPANRGVSVFTFFLLCGFNR